MRCREDKKDAEREVEIMSKIRHPNVVRYFESWTDNRNTLSILMEFCESGDLDQLIKSRKRPFKELRIWRILSQIFSGLAHLHENRILHRDMKPSNVLLSRNSEGEEVVKIGDLGVARTLGSQSDFAKTIVGTPYYLSPELCEDRPYDEKSDVWAVGCIAFELAERKRAFEAGNQAALIVKIMSGKSQRVGPEWSKSLQKLISQSLSKRAKERPAMAELVQVSQALGYGFESGTARAVPTLAQTKGKTEPKKRSKIDVIDARAPRRKGRSPPVAEKRNSAQNKSRRESKKIAASKAAGCSWGKALAPLYAIVKASARSAAAAGDGCDVETMDLSGAGDAAVLRALEFDLGVPSDKCRSVLGHLYSLLALETAASEGAKEYAVVGNGFVPRGPKIFDQDNWDDSSEDSLPEYYEFAE